MHNRGVPLARWHYRKRRHGLKVADIKEKITGLRIVQERVLECDLHVPVRSGIENVYRSRKDRCLILANILTERGTEGVVSLLGRREAKIQVGNGDLRGAEDAARREGHPGDEVLRPRRLQ